MSNDDELTATEERVAANQQPAPIVSLDRKVDDPAAEPATGLPPGMHDTDASPLGGNDDQTTAKT